MQIHCHNAERIYKDLIETAKKNRTLSNEGININKNESIRLL